MRAPEWLLSALDRVVDDRPSVLATIAAVEGSSPREAGAKMLVWADGQADTLGGGRLEYEVTARAHRLLDTPSDGHRVLERYVLGPELEQCCGGAVSVVLERIGYPDRGWLDVWHRALTDDTPLEVLTPLSPPGKKRLRRAAPDATAGAMMVGGALVETTERPVATVYLFGAGHVGTALAGLLSALRFRVIWIDGRPDAFGSKATGRGAFGSGSAVPDGVRALAAARPALEIGHAPKGTFAVVMTHDHGLDEAIVEAALLRDDLAFVGLIGSETKGFRIRNRLARKGLAEHRIARLTCPLGLAAVPGKRPAEVALSAAAQLLSLAQGMQERRAER